MRAALLYIEKERVSFSFSSLRRHQSTRLQSEKESKRVVIRTHSESQKRETAAEDFQYGNGKGCPTSSSLVLTAAANKLASFTRLLYLRWPGIPSLVLVLFALSVIPYCFSPFPFLMLVCVCVYFGVWVCRRYGRRSIEMRTTSSSQIYLSYPNVDSIVYCTIIYREWQSCQHQIWTSSGVTNSECAAQILASFSSQSYPDCLYSLFVTHYTLLPFVRERKEEEEDVRVPTCTQKTIGSSSRHRPHHPSTTSHLGVFTPFCSLRRCYHNRDSLSLILLWLEKLHLTTTAAVPSSRYVLVTVCDNFSTACLADDDVLP